MDGVLNILKPPGMTSHDVVAVVRRLFPGAKAGHTGTLDPSAAGVLVVCLGRALKLGELLFAASKVYRFALQLGVRTDTQDAEGQVISRRPTETVTREALEAACAGLQGEWEMTPPQYSAVRVAGCHSYELARKGQAPSLKARRVTIERLEVLSFASATALALLEVACSKGTYVRALGDELGERLGCGGHVRFLVRTQSGAHRLTEAVTLEELNREPTAQVRPLAEAVGHLPAVTMPEEALAVLRLRGALAVPGHWPANAEVVRVLDADGMLVCVAEVSRGGNRPLVRATKVLR